MSTHSIATWIHTVSLKLKNTICTYIQLPPQKKKSRECATSGSVLQQWGIPAGEMWSPSRPGLNPSPGVCVTDRGCVFSSRPLELFCFLYPVTGQKLNTPTTTKPILPHPPNPQALSTPSSIHAVLFIASPPFLLKVGPLEKKTLSK